MPEDDRSLRAGDRVKLNGRNEGRVLRLIGDMADVVEHRILGRRAVWRIRASGKWSVVLAGHTLESRAPDGPWETHATAYRAGAG